MPSACKSKNNGRFIFKRNRLLHFVKPISQENLDYGELKIPNKFVRRYGGDLSNTITLKVPTDAEWKVELVKTNNQYWLQDGFKEFADYYSLCPGSLLVFECESSSSIFHVLIFDFMSAMEIYYPFRLINDDEEPNHEQGFPEPNMAEEANIEGEFQEANKEERTKLEGEFQEPNKEAAAANLEEVNIEGEFQEPDKEEETKLEREFQVAANIEEEIREINLEVILEEDFQNQLEEEANIEGEIREVSLEEANPEEEFGEPNIAETEDDVFMEDSSPSRKMKYKSSVPHPEFKKIIGTNLTGKFDSCAKPQASAPSTGDESVSIVQEKSDMIIGSNLTNKFDSCGKSQTSIPSPSTDDESVRMPQQKSPTPCSTNHTPQFEGRGGRDVSTEKKRLSVVPKKRTEPLTAEEKANALDRAKNAFKSTNPFFMVVMQPSYINMGNNLNIPYNFVKRHIKEKGGDIILRSSDGRTWTVKYRVRISKKQSTAGIVGSCWKGFVVDNNLEVGDVCAFELIKGNEISLQVVIFRASEYENYSLSPTEASGDDQVEPEKRMEAESESDPNSKRGGRTYGPDDESIARDLQLPESDSKTELADMRGANEVEPDKSFVAEIESKFDANRTSDGKISGPGNETITGDLQLPESDSKTDYDENKNGELQLPESDSKTEPEKCRKYELENSIDEPVDRCFEAESDFSSPYPFFKFVVRSCYSESCTMPVPFSFIESHFKDKVQTINLQVADGLWPVKLTVYSSFKIGCLSGGWAAFAEENSLQSGDVCAFELVKSDLLKVTIFRNGS